NVAHLIEREVEKAPDEEPQVSLFPYTTLFRSKGYHSSETVLALQQAKARSYIPEPKRPRRKWAGKAPEQKAVYANGRRVKGSYGKRLLKKRGELIERSFAHCYETGAMRRGYLRGRENVMKRQLIHVGAFNLSLICRQKLGAGTPRGLRNLQQEVVFVILSFPISCETIADAIVDLAGAFRHRVGVISCSLHRNCRHQFSSGSTTDCYAPMCPPVSWIVGS